MVTSTDCLNKYGEPSADNPYMMMLVIPANLELYTAPKKVWCNKDMAVPLVNALSSVKFRGLSHELKTWDGCFNIRKKRGLTSMSLHSWGIAVDINAFENGLGLEPKLSAEFVKCFTDNGFDWGGTWRRKDGMHFQLRTI